jgi:hypothetical protein
MSLDERVKDELNRGSRRVAPDERRGLSTIRKRARRAVLIQRISIVGLAAAVTLGAIVVVPRLTDASDRRLEPGGSATPSTDHPLDGAWTQLQSCEDVVRALTRYGLPQRVAGALLATHVREGPGSAVAADPHPCRQAGPPVRRTWVMDGTTMRGYIGERRRKVDFASFEMVDDHTIRVSHITLHFRIDENVLRFTVPPLPLSCTGPGCRSQHVWAVAAFGLGPWSRTTRR